MTFNTPNFNEESKQENFNNNFNSNFPNSTFYNSNNNLPFNNENNNNTIESNNQYTTNTINTENDCRFTGLLLFCVLCSVRSGGGAYRNRQQPGDNR